jgi:hypothetical protein
MVLSLKLQILITLAVRTSVDCAFWCLHWATDVGFCLLYLLRSHSDQGNKRCMKWKRQMWRRVWCSLPFKCGPAGVGHVPHLRGVRFDWTLRGLLPGQWLRHDSACSPLLASQVRVHGLLDWWEEVKNMANWELIKFYSLSLHPSSFYPKRGQQEVMICLC